MVELYKIEIDRGVTSITCLVCGKKSHNPKDIKYRYCGKCARFLDDTVIDPAERKPDSKMEEGG